MSDDTIDDSIKVTRREVIKGVGAFAAATVATAAVATVSSSAALAASEVDTESGEVMKKVDTTDRSKQMNGAAAFFKSLTHNGIEVAFTTPGTSEMQVVDEIGYSDMKVVSCIFENTVTGAADGYYRLANKPALGLLHVGSGVMNSLANMHNASRAGSSMVLYGGGVHVTHEVNDPEHNAKQRAPQLAAGAADWVFEARNAHELGQSAAQAIQAAAQENGKIAYVFGPNNAVWGETSLQLAKVVPCTITRVDKYTIEDVASSLKAGKKTAFILGGNALSEAGLDWAGRIADKTGATLYREWVNMKLVDGGAGRPAVKRLDIDTRITIEELAQFDQIVLVSGRIPISPFSYESMPFTALPEDMHVKTLAPRDADTIAALQDLGKALGVARKPKSLNKRVVPDAPKGPFNGTSVVQSIVRSLPKDAVVVDESWYEGYTLHAQLAFAEPHTLMVGAVGGAIGGGIPLAIGCGIAAPKRKIVVVTGDWSMMQGCQSLWTVANQDLDMCIICLNNSGSASLESELARVRKGDAQAKSLEMVDLISPTIKYGEMATSMGVPHTVATSAEAFQEQFEAAMNTKGPHFIDAKVESFRAVLVAARMKDRNMPNAKDGRGNKGWDVLPPE
jgi:acetolactate synthase-1/2/3 large subunit